MFLGNPDIALTISVIIAIFTFGLNRGKSMKEIMDSVDSAIKTIGTLIQDATLSPLFMGWLFKEIFWLNSQRNYAYMVRT